MDRYLNSVIAIRLGLTGGIGSGKSTVAEMLQKRGAAIVDADAISRATTAPHGSAIAGLEAAFGADILTQERALDREKMRKLVFSDPPSKKVLEGIVHPLVGLESARQADLAEAQGARCIVFDIPLLVESIHWRQSLHRVLVIDCCEETQIARVVQRNGLDPQSVKQVISSQVSRSRRLKAADCVINNDALSLESLESQVREIGTLFGL